MPVPVIVGVVTLVMPSPATPLSLEGARASAVGTLGMVVSMVTFSAAVGADTLLAASVWVAVRLCTPAAGVSGVKLHRPPNPTMTAPSTVATPFTVSVTMTVLPGSAVPVMAGVATLVMPSPSTPLSDAGASASPAARAGKAPAGTSVKPCGNALPLPG